MASQLAKESKVEIEKEGVCVCVCVCERERGARRKFEWSEENSRKFLQVLRATRENSRKILRKENSSKKSALVCN